MNRDTWVEEAKERLLSNAKTTDKAVTDLMFVYEEAAAEIEIKIQAMYGKYAKKNGLTLEQARSQLSSKEYRKWRMSLEKYVSQANKLGKNSRTLDELNILSIKSSISRQEQLLTQVYQSMMELAGDTEAKVETLLKDVVKTNYERECFVLQKGTGVCFQVARLNPDLISQVIRHEWSGANFSQRVWDNVDKLAITAKREITLGLIKGSSVDQMAREINRVMERGKYAAERLVRTEVSHFVNEAQKLAYEESGIEEYEFLGGGCEDCNALNGSLFKISEAEVGLNYPPIHPNCRCTTVAVFKNGMFGNKETSQLDEDISFKEWEKGNMPTELSAKVGGSDGVELHEEKKLLEIIDASNHDVVESKIEEYTDKIRNADVENAVVVTKDGAVYQCFGTSSKVYPDYDLGDKLIGADVTHNHLPKETHYSFSGNDVGLFLQRGLNSLTGTDDKYTYKITRTDKTIVDNPEIVIDKFKNEYYLNAMQLAMEGKIDADCDTYHEIMIQFARDYNFHYERSPI